MLVEVRPIYRCGKPVPTAVRRKEAPHRGKLCMQEDRMHVLGRVVLCARLANNTDPNEAEVLPELLDAQVIWVADSKMRVRGVEKVGEAFYAQTWDVEVLSC